MSRVKHMVKPRPHDQSGLKLAIQLTLDKLEKNDRVKAIKLSTKCHQNETPILRSNEIKLIPSNRYIL